MITPMDIHNKTFSKGLRGYSEEEVNDFLRQIVADYEQIYREHREMEEQMDQMKTKLANYEKISETMTNTLQLAKDTAENVKKNAKRNAEILIANAHAEGNRQIREAEESRRRLVENMIRTEGNMKTYVGKIRKDLQLALAAIDALDRMEAPKVAGFPPVEEKKEEPKAEETPAAEETPKPEETETAETVETAETAEVPETEEKAEAEEAPAEETEEKKE
ncbi:DivIVA domain-containing protein [uncultured Dialister sp.]|uniref:DivIVA domain-containing protein n=1 Tax=uncultured Dialister sp. TaxID=278064 RepID=UPI0027DC8F48|nr:DivIVA domain-containing protein [uncultured Dialister sp.]